MREMIYVEVLDEGSPAYQGLDSEKVADGIYRLGLPPSPYDPEDLILAFVPGTLVRCRLLELHGGPQLVAFEEVK